ncbi:benzoate/H(+) symporter BenE family transporter [Paeniglutamicibacter gangotriensis]|uniref:benzoate/H(+) symporter BenE family transporter n=1 Tax=Paeniglutamicibacter gangotriensis TaxID=254787 RepID=UPI001376A8F8
MLLHTNGYAPNDRLLLSYSSIASMLFVPFGSQASNLPAFTEGTCCGLGAHENPAKRDAAAAAGGGFSTCSGCSAPPWWSCLLRFSVSRSLRYQLSRCWGAARGKSCDQTAAVQAPADPEVSAVEGC